MFLGKSKRNTSHYDASVAKFPTHLDEILRLIRDKQGSATIFQEILRVAVDLLQIDPEYAYLRTIDAGTSSTKLLTTLQSRFANRAIAGDTASQGITGRAISTGLPQLVPDVRRDPQYVKLSEKTRSELAVPLIRDHQCIGVLNFEAESLKWFTAEDVRWMSILAEVAVLAETLNQERDLMEKQRVDQATTQAMSAILDDIISLFPSDAGLMAEVLGYIGTAEQLVTYALRPESAIALYIRLRRGEGTIGKVAETRRPVVGDVTGRDEDATHLRSTRSVLVLPLLDHQGHLQGILNLESSNLAAFSQQDVDRLQNSLKVQELLSLLQQLDREGLHDQTIVSRILGEFENRVFAIVDPEHLDELYHVILEFAAQVVERLQVSGALLLIRDSRLSVEPGADPAGGTDRYITVVASKHPYRVDAAERNLNEVSRLRDVVVSGKPRVEPDIARLALEQRGANRDMTHGSEAIVPLLDVNGQPIGVLDLFCAVADGFTERDAENLVLLAQYAAQAIQRANDIERAKRYERQQDYGDRIANRLPATFSDAKTITDVMNEQDRLDRERTALLLDLKDWAKRETGSDYAAIVLPERTESVKQVRLSAYFADPTPNDVPAFWTIDRDAAQKSLTALAYVGQKTTNNQDVTRDPNYFAYYPDVKSEMDAPILDKTESVGVLNLESKTLRHYTVTHRLWGEFFAKQVTTTLRSYELASKVLREQTIKILSQEVSDGIAIMRQSDADHLLEQRSALRQKLVDYTCRVTNSKIGVIALAVNAYKRSETSPDEADAVPDYENGLLLVVTQSPNPEGGPDLIFPLIRNSTTGQAFRENRMIVYNRRLDRPGTFLTDVPGLPLDIESSVVVPLTEGARPLGVLALESNLELNYPPERVSLIVEIARLASEIIIAARLRAEELQGDQLRTFEIETLNRQEPDEDAYIQLILNSALDLADVGSAGWATLTQVRSYPQEQQNIIRRVSTYTTRDTPDDTVREVKSGHLNEDRPIIDDPVFQRVLQTKYSVLILDLLTQYPDYYEQFDQARSIVAVPIIQPVENWRDRRVTGILMVASPQPRNINENDRRILEMFSETVALGLQNNSLLAANREFTLDLSHDLVITLSPLRSKIQQLRREVEDLAPQLTGKVDDIRGLADLYTNIILWSLDVSAQKAVESEESIVPLLVDDIRKAMEASTQELARLRTKRNVVWQVEDESLTVAGNDNRSRLIEAALFKYIENGIKYGPTEDVTVTARRRDASVQSLGRTWVEFEVRSRGELISKSDEDQIFELGYRVAGTSGAPGSGRGLYLVREAATKLGGKAFYRADEPDHNCFVLWLPPYSQEDTNHEANRILDR